jgi:hypothetical protein
MLVAFVAGWRIGNVLLNISAIAKIFLYFSFVHIFLLSS